jgi:hypothetical protein
MFPFWDDVVAPLIRAASPRAVVEIGALRGDSTTRLLATLPRDCVLHVIDPVPQFDPEAHRARFGDRYRFHQALSLRVLPTLDAVDVALIDGDHNWYTVFHELRELHEAADRAGRAGPLCLLHDVAWPYGRRDGYYDRTNVPTDQQQPSARLGMARGRSALLDSGGTNPHIWNACHEGGPRNGVRTALEDFVALDPERFRCTVLDDFVGLGIVVDQRRLGEAPALGAALDAVVAADSRADLSRRIEAAARSGLRHGR